MKHILLKFNYGVEIGAYLAYSGHYSVTGDYRIRLIAKEELVHRLTIRKILTSYGERPSKVFNFIFGTIGKSINFLCHYSPTFLMDFVARSMEIFAVISYRHLAKLYPEHEQTFISMAEAEDVHKRYFARGV